MNCVLYARVSTGKQADKELSIPAQLGAARAYAQERGWTITEEFVESGASATTAERPVLKRLLERLQDGESGVRVVLVHKIDRLARNVHDHVTIRALLKRHSVQLASVVENVDDSVSGQLVENIMASIAQFYSANLGEEVKKGMRQKVLGGGWPHAAPCGYVQVALAEGNATAIEIHPRLGPLVRRAFELFATNAYSVKALGALLAREGLRARSGGPLAPSHIQRLLTNPFYVSRLRWKGIEVRGRHPALVTEEQFEAVQRALDDRRKQRRTKGLLSGVPLRGVAMCATCRGHMTAERHGRLRYYRCSRQAYRRDRCPSKFCNADVAHESLGRICEQIRLSTAAAKAIKKAARRIVAERQANRMQAADGLTAERQQLVKRKMTITHEFANGRLPPQEALGQTAVVDSHLKSIDDASARNSADPRAVIAKVDRIVNLSTSLWSVYQGTDDQSRAALLREVFKVITIGPDGVVGFSLNSPFGALVESGSRACAAAATELLDAT